MADNKNRVQTSTQIRNLYSEGMAYLNMSFYNTNLSFKLYPYTGRDNSGRSSYDMKNGLSTTVNFEGAYILAQVSNDIIAGKIIETDVNIPCASGASIVLSSKVAPNGYPEVLFSINKNNTTVTFKFPVYIHTIKKPNGATETECIQSGLGAFKETVQGYLNGINADRHLDKFTEDYVKSLEGSQQQNNYNNQQNNNYNNFNNGNNNGYKKQYNPNYKKPYNQNYKKPYNNNNGGNSWPPPQQQNLDSYEIKN